MNETWCARREREMPPLASSHACRPRPVLAASHAGMEDGRVASLTRQIQKTPSLWALPNSLRLCHVWPMSGYISPGKLEGITSSHRYAGNSSLLTYNMVTGVVDYHSLAVPSCIPLVSLIWPYMGQARVSLLHRWIVNLTICSKVTVLEDTSHVVTMREARSTLYPPCCLSVLQLLFGTNFLSSSWVFPFFPFIITRHDYAPPGLWRLGHVSLCTWILSLSLSLRAPLHL